MPYPLFKDMAKMLTLSKFTEGIGSLMGLCESGHYLRRLLFFALFSAALFTVDPARAEYLTASGCSVSNVGYLTELAREYERLTGIKVYVRGGGTLVGIEDLRGGKVDFAASCRQRTNDDPKDIQFVQVAWDALVFISHKTNPITNISLDDVRAIYDGRITNWKQITGIDARIKVFISRARKGLSGVEWSTKEMVLKGKDPVETPHTVSLASTAIVEQMVEDTPEGFATTGFSSARKRDVKILKVNGVAPTQKNIINGRYPLKRPLFILLPQKPKPETKKFLDFVLSKAGQRFISSQGVVSLLDIQ
jgi:phosphate transport system substrate-binding protein